METITKPVVNEAILACPKGCGHNEEFHYCKTIGLRITPREDRLTAERKAVVEFEAAEGMKLFETAKKTLMDELKGYIKLSTYRIMTEEDGYGMEEAKDGSYFYVCFKNWKETQVRIMVNREMGTWRSGRTLGIEVKVSPASHYEFRNLRLKTRTYSANFPALMDSMKVWRGMQDILNKQVTAAEQTRTATISREERQERERAMMAKDFGSTSPVFHNSVTVMADADKKTYTLAVKYGAAGMTADEVKQIVEIVTKADARRNQK